MKKGEDQLSYATSKKNVHKFKIVFIGDQYVGKSSIINRFIKNQFDQSHNATIGIDFVSKNLVVRDKTVRLQLWDTAGQQRFRSLIPNYLRDSQVAFIVFDLSNYQTFQAVTRWVDFIKQFRGDDVLIFAIGNKLDLAEQRKIQTIIAKEKFESLGLKYFEVSAKSGVNLESTFRAACEFLLNVPAGTTQDVRLMESVVQTKGKNKQLQGIIQQPQHLQIVKRSRLQNPKKTESRIVKEKNCC